MLCQSLPLFCVKKLPRKTHLFVLELSLCIFDFVRQKIRMYQPHDWPRVAELLTKSTYVRMDNNHDGEAAHVLKELHINVAHSKPARFAKFGC